MERSVISIPPQRSSPPANSRLRPRINPTRSTLELPPRIKALQDSLPCSLFENSQSKILYTFLSVIQYLSDFTAVGDGFEFSGRLIRNQWPLSGRGRTYEVRRYSEGHKEDVDLYNNWRHSYALKCLRVSGDEDEDAASLRYRSLIQELRILRHGPLSNHPSFLRVFGLSWESDESNFDHFLPVLHTEFATFGTLSSFLSSWLIPFRQKRRLILNVAEGLLALHSCAITHGDVKMENVLVFPSDDLDYPFIGKVSDFGFAMDTSSLADSSDYLVGFTPLWAAPEASNKLLRSRMHLTDIYSFGFVIWSVVLNGQNPFKVHVRHLPTEPQSRLEAFKFLKETDELLNVAVDQLHSVELDPDTDLVEIFNFLLRTLRYDPNERDLSTVVKALQETPGQKNDTEFEPLQSFDPKKVISSTLTYYSQSESFLNLLSILCW